MVEDLRKKPVAASSQYLTIIPLILSLLLFQKAQDGTRLPFVFIIVALTFVSNCANIVFNSTFICEEPMGPDMNAKEDKYKYWKEWFAFVFWLSNLGNYVFFVCLYKWQNSYRK